MFDKNETFIDHHIFKEALCKVCLTKRKLSSSITDCIENISIKCIDEINLGQKFKLNILMLQSIIDSICSIEEKNFTDNYRNGIILFFREKLN